MAVFYINAAICVISFWCGFCIKRTAQDLFRYKRDVGLFNMNVLDQFMTSGPNVIVDDICLITDDLVNNISFNKHAWKRILLVDPEIEYKKTALKYILK